jgi:hypothetical protein
VPYAHFVIFEHELMSLQAQSIENFASILKSFFSSKYMVLRSVELSSILPSLQQTEFASLKLNLVLSTKDYIPIVVFDFIPEGKSITDHEFSSIAQHRILSDAEIPLVYIDCNENPDIEKIEAIVDDAILTMNRRLTKESKIDQNTVKPESKPRQKYFYLKLAFVAISGFYIYTYFGAKLTPKTTASFNIDPNVQIPQDSSDQDSPPQDASTVAKMKAKIDAMSRKCDLSPPPNGTTKTFKSNITKMPDAYWKIDNKTEYHAYAWAYLDNSKIAEIYVAPNHSFVLKVPSIQYIYKVYLTKNWCNSNAMNNPIGYEPSLISSDRLPVSFKKDTLATTGIEFDVNNLNTYTNVVEVDPQ